ncbi:ABC transporter transmembrane domain-containing protein [Paenibacillus sp. GCM10012303]|uniref:ABC transporter transmembrane domain-containing protein n=1 Tax=Paenibacillus sp. GCM10012303 TaxID=3317340 RepID=UPI00361E5E86
MATWNYRVICSRFAGEDRVRERSRRTYGYCLSYLSPYRLLFAGLLVCNLLLSLIEMTIPKGIQIVIDHLLPSRSVSLFYWLLAGIGALIMLMLALTVLRNHWQRVIQEQAARDLQLDVFRKLRELGLAYTDRQPD